MNQNKLTKYFKSSKDDADKMTTNQATIDVENVNESSETIIEITTDKPFHPPATYPFPKKKYGTRERGFQAHWPKDFPWLHYAEKQTFFEFFVFKVSQLLFQFFILYF